MNLGTPEILLIVLALILIFGVGKLGNVGGALGKSIREFRKERDRVDDVALLTIGETKEEKKLQTEIKSDDQSKY